MSVPGCYAVFTTTTAEDFSPFLFHYHDPAFASDVPETAFVVPCVSCLVNNAEWQLIYENAVQPPAEAGIDTIPPA